MPKRQNSISWDEYFMGIAVLSSMRSKDPDSQVGAAIRSPENILLGTGYNGLPYGYNDDEFEWSREGGILVNKYGPVVHAELNSILNSIGNLKDCIIYSFLFPCHECAKPIIQKKFSEVVYLSDKYNGTDSNILAKRMFREAEIKTRQYIPKNKQLILDFDSINRSVANHK